MRKTISISILAAFFILQILPYLPASVQNIPLVNTLEKASIFHPAEIDAAGISSASATLTNPRLSFHGLVNTTIAIGGSVAVVKSTGAGGDYNTRNIFPNDGVKIDTNAVISVASVSSNLTTFTLKTPLTAQALNDTNMTVAQGGQLKMQIFTASSIPVGGSIKISVPAPNQLVALTTNGIPLAETSLANSGFDTNGMTNANTTCPGTFTAGTFTAGASGTPHTFTCNYSGGTALAAGTPLTVIIGDNSVPLINPAPISGSHAQGVADIYSIKAETFTGANGSGTLLEDGFARTAPIEGVLVTATVDETLQFTIAGVAAGASTYCGQAHSAGITTTATAVPWGTLGSGYVIDKNEAVQQLIVTTNASSGYKVYAEENDQMGMDGEVCTGTAPSAGEFTFGTGTCIRDANVGSISHTVAADWGATPGSNYGFGYATQGTDALVAYNSGGTYMARQFADQQGSEDKYATNAEVMGNTGPVSASAVYVCYRINIPGTQPAGYYFSKLKYTAVPKF